MLQRIKRVEYLDGYKLRIHFLNGEVKIVDFEEWIRNGKGYLLPLKKIEYFKKVRVDDCQYTICWPNGADFCPDVLYEVGEEVKNIKHKKTPSVQDYKPKTKAAAKEKRRQKIIS